MFKLWCEWGIRQLNETIKLYEGTTCSGRKAKRGKTYLNASQLVLVLLLIG